MPTLTLHGSYDLGMVLASVAIAIAAAYATVGIANTTATFRGQRRRSWLVFGGIAIGVGIWSMHYVGMLAYRLPIEVRYHVPTVLLSLLAAVIACAGGLAFASRDTLEIPHAIAGASVMGGGIAAMHYIGIAAMRLPATASYNAPVVALSLLAAFAIGVAALKLTFRTRVRTALSHRITTALMMGAAIPVMHYIGMAAVHFETTAAPANFANTVGVSLIGIVSLVVFTGLLLTFALAVASLSQKVETQSQRLHKSETLFRELADNIRDVFWATDANITTMLYVSPAYEQVWGRSAETLYEDPASWTESLVPEHRQRVAEAMQHFAKTGHFDEEYTIVHPDGRKLDILARGFPSKDSEGRIRHLVGIAQDITERKHHLLVIEQKNQELQLRNLQIERVNQLKSDFMSSVSHELRTPLNIISGFSELLEERTAGPLNDAQVRYVEHIRAGTKRLLVVIENILMFSRIDPERVPLNLESFDVESAVQQIVADLQSRFSAQNIHPKIRMDSGLTVFADRARFKQIVYNLLDNALKFTPQDGNIEVTGEYCEDSVRIAVVDSGVGIKPEDQEVIFEKFYQVGETIRGVKEGTGLGLSISKLLVEKHDGSIGVISQLGKGSQFFFALPSRHGKKVPSDSSLRL